MFRIIAISILAIGIAGDVLTDVTSGHYGIIFRHSGLALDVDNSVDPAGANNQK